MISDRLIDGAILLLLGFLVVWVGFIVTALSSEEGDAGDQVSAGTPARGEMAAPFTGGAAPAGWRLAWHDEFDQASCPSPAKWSFERGFVRNGELQWYQPQNAYCRDGDLVLEARREERPNPSYRHHSPNWKLNRSAASRCSRRWAARATRWWTCARRRSSRAS